MCAQNKLHNSHTHTASQKHDELTIDVPYHDARYLCTKKSECNAKTKRNRTAFADSMCGVCFDEIPLCFAINQFEISWTMIHFVQQFTPTIFSNHMRARKCALEMWCSRSAMQRGNSNQFNHQNELVLGFNYYNWKKNFRFTFFFFIFYIFVIFFNSFDNLMESFAISKKKQNFSFQNDENHIICSNFSVCFFEKEKWNYFASKKMNVSNNAAQNFRLFSRISGKNKLNQPSNTPEHWTTQTQWVKVTIIGVPC